MVSATNIRYASSLVSSWRKKTNVFLLRTWMFWFWWGAWCQGPRKNICLGSSLKHLFIWSISKEYVMLKVSLPLLHSTEFHIWCKNSLCSHLSSNHATSSPASDSQMRDWKQDCCKDKLSERKKMQYCAKGKEAWNVNKETLFCGNSHLQAVTKPNRKRKIGWYCSLGWVLSILLLRGRGGWRRLRRNNAPNTASSTLSPFLPRGVESIGLITEYRRPAGGRTPPHTF